MSRSTFRVLFYLKRNAPKKNGLVPVMCRITVNGKISQFSCKLDVEEKLWSVSLGRMSGRSIVAQEANRMLDKIRVGINKAYQEIMDRDGYVSAEKVRNAFLGMGQNHKTLLAVFRQHNEDYAKQVGKMKSQRSYWKYCTVYKHLEEFIKHRYKVSDIALRELSPAFITDFELFLRTEKNHCTNTVWSYMMPFRSIIYTAINNGWLQRDPFYTYRITKEETKRGFLTKEEITMLINGTFKKKSYEHRLVELHRKRVANGERSVLVGLQSFAEGLDLKGDLLSQVHIHKIAFPDRKSTRLNSSHPSRSRMPSSA